jgi:RNA polymerase sigma-70 factor (ECF subfamily)
MARTLMKMGWQHLQSTGWMKLDHSMPSYSILTATLLVEPRLLAHMDPETLLARAHMMDEAALTELHEQFFPVVYRFVRFRLDDEQLVEDITSEVFLRLLDALRQKHKNVRDLRSWLLGVASNMVYDHLRQKYRHPTDELENHEDLPDGLHPEAIVERNVSDQMIRDYVKELTEDQQKVLSLRFSQGMSVGETARIVNKSVNAVKVLQFRALSTLRRLIEGRRDVL